MTTVAYVPDFQPDPPLIARASRLVQSKLLRTGWVGAYWYNQLLGVMTPPKPPAEYKSYASLMFLGEELDPKEVSRLLHMRPTQAWHRGERIAHAPASTHQWGGWKKSLPKSLECAPLERQLRFWTKTLADRAGDILSLEQLGYVCALNCYVGTKSTASLTLPNALLRAIAAIGVELRVSCFAHAEDA